MRVSIIGGGGFLGQKLAKALAGKGELRGRRIASMVLADMVDPAPVDAPFPVATASCDIRDRAQVDAAVAGADVVYHLAAIVSAQAEAEFDLGLDINLMGSLNVFQAARALGTAPVVVFTSSVAVYGGDVPDMIEDWTALNPQTSYGAQKAAAELILTDMSRKGFIDGRGLRLPTITVRPGRPNKASTGFMSSIFREPLQGEAANCPVGRDFPVWHCSPRAIVGNLVHAAEIETQALGRNRCFALPGRTDTIGEMVDAMTRIAGPDAASRITWERDDWIEGIVREFRTRLNPQKALALGFKADASFEDNIRFFLEDDVRRG
ncbi:MAG TPA: D-erythronate dehydrogenase [Paracoccaceae bacterium]|nr:D-erythronate dehydrogenase [Paracoccaceae bacterium]